MVSDCQPAPLHHGRQVQGGQGGRRLNNNGNGNNNTQKQNTSCKANICYAAVGALAKKIEAAGCCEM